MNATLRQPLHVSFCNLKTYKNQYFIYLFGIKDIFSAFVSTANSFFYRVISHFVDDKRFCVYQFIAQ